MKENATTTNNNSSKNNSIHNSCDYKSNTTNTPRILHLFSYVPFPPTCISTPFCVMPPSTRISAKGSLWCESCCMACATSTVWKALASIAARTICACSIFMIKKKYINKRHYKTQTKWKSVKNEKNVNTLCDEKSNKFYPPAAPRKQIQVPQLSHLTIVQQSYNNHTTILPTHLPTHLSVEGGEAHDCTPRIVPPVWRKQAGECGHEVHA
jgi:hypothetical protein